MSLDENLAMLAFFLKRDRPAGADGDGELQVAVIQLRDFDISPQFLDILREKRAVAFEHLDRENDIVAGDRRPVMPDGVGAEREVVDRAFLIHTPGFGQVGLR